MKEFVKYQHIERFGTSETEGIEFGECYVFPKLDGTNASVWIDESGVICAGSRNRKLSIEQDNAGFLAHVSQDINIILYLSANPTHRLYGEWLVPHTVKSYNEDAWRKFYVFDVAIDCPDGEFSEKTGRSVEYLPYDVYKPIVEMHELGCIPPIAIIENSNYEQFVKQLDKNVFLMQDGKGAGEGIVIKNYEFKNKYGRQTWAKIVTSEFKEKHGKVMGTPKMSGKKMVEEEIANEFVTKALCEKVKAKIELDNDGFFIKNIPQLLNTVFYDLIKEESWNYVKKHKNPTINYKTLQHFAFAKVRECIPELF